MRTNKESGRQDENLNQKKGSDRCGIEPPKEMEIIAELNKLINNKSADEIRAEVLKFDGEGLKQRIINNVWENEQMSLAYN
ncbi:hypothetical protein QE152_g27363 [Popillia japonica]|uniref:Uncharacterized protein n=1 Tax=Popillia japonica TaxID=7064 RepID=A0AAW1JUY2_POPJA